MNFRVFLLCLSAIHFTKTQVAPQITTHPQNTTVTEGNNITLSCNASGDPEPTISWFRGGSVLTSDDSRIFLGADSKQLTITSIKRNNTGEYRCVANNSAGNATSDVAKLIVQYPPEFSEHPQNRTALEGLNVAFSCNASGNPTPKFSWTKNGSPINTTASARISLSAGNKQLNITSVNRVDSGEYRCVADNSVGAVNSSGAFLTVQYQPEISEHPQNQIVLEGFHVSLLCNASGNPTPTFSWTINGSPVNTTSNPRITFSAYNKQLTITSVKRTDGGEYKCLASNSVKTVNSTAAFLIVQYPSAFSEDPQNKTVLEGLNVAFSCNASGNPTPKFSWTKNGSPINTTDNARISLSAGNKQLNITNVNRVDSGKYRCVAENSVGAVNSSAAFLTVQYQPEISEHPQNQIVLEGFNVSLLCNASGNPTPTFSWTINGSPVNTTSNPRITFSAYNKQLTITSVKRTDGGEYKCLASNSVKTVNSTAAFLIVQYPSEFSEDPQNQTVLEGLNVAFSCNASGNPTPKFSWTKNGSPINTTDNARISLSAGNKQLNITNVNRVDSGKYRCVAENSVGAVNSSAAFLTVQYQPEISEHPQNQIVLEGFNVSLLCNAIGNPTPTFSWTINGSPVNTTSNPRITFSAYNKQLTITSVKRTDGGEYKCLASNSVKTVNSTAAFLIVQYPSEFSEDPQNQTVLEGLNVAFSCNASGNPTPKFSWTKNGSPINTTDNARISLSAGNKQLNITNVNRVDSGEYRCVANNSVGAVSSSAAFLTVQYQPEISEHPQNQIVLEGFNVSLLCNASGNPRPTFSWTINGSPVNTTSNPRITFLAYNKQLSITSVKRTDGGEYKCLASNSVKTVNSTAAFLIVQYISEFSEHPQNQTVLEGLNVAFSCNASGNPTPKFSWTKNGSPINTTDNATISLSAGNKQLNITNVNRVDSGEYRCVADNSVGAVNSNAAFLTVQYQPEISEHPQNQIVLEGFNVSLLCNAIGNPTPTFSWTINGSPVNTTSNPRITFSAYNKQLTITSVKRTDGGEYKCLASNSVKTVNSTAAFLIVQYPSEFSEDPQNQTVLEGLNVAFSCNASGNPTPKFSWTKNGSPINTTDNARISLSAGNKQLNITNVNRVDSGEYRCVANNSVGAVSSSAAFLTVQYQPEISEHPQNQIVLEGFNVSLLCNASGNPRPTFSWTINGSPVNTTSNPRITFSAYNKQLSITSVKRTDGGEYKCLASNSVKTVNSTAAFLIVQYISEFSEHPQNQTVLEGLNVAFSCNASGNPTPKFSWTKNGSPINTTDNATISLSAGNKQLNITNVNRVDSGEYRCVADNSVGAVNSSAAFLTVQYQPEISEHPQNQIVLEGFNVSLLCNAIGNPTPTFSWTINGSPVNTTSNPRITFSAYNKQLTITNVKRTDGGEYKCLASNSVKTVNSTAAFLIVQYPSEFSEHPQNRTVLEGLNVAFSCNASGNPTPKFSWTKNGSPINTTDNARISLSAGNKQLNITNVNRVDSGEYRCVANNSVGAVNSSAAFLIVQYQPEISEHPQNQIVLEGLNVSFLCNASGNPTPTFSWTINGSPVNVTVDSRISFSADNKQLTITRVNRTDGGEYICFASNPVKTVTSTAASLIVQCKETFTYVSLILCISKSLLCS
ncbi:hemicentin-1-like [Porites lutea]|uniref:hemicentin-1-like n=1 Tax=Porites lutea TaxID=51062 RepID=UPI003CC62C6E